MSAELVSPSAGRRLLLVVTVLGWEVPASQSEVQESQWEVPA